MEESNYSPLGKVADFLHQNPDVVEWGKSIISKGGKEEIGRIVDELGGELDDEQIYAISDRVGDFVQVYIQKKGIFSYKVGKMISRGATSYAFDALKEYFKK